MPNLQTEFRLDAIGAGTHVVLPFHDLLWDGGQDSLTEIASAVVHIKTGNGQENPIVILLPVGMVVGNQIGDVGGSFLAGQFFYSLS